MECGFYFWGEGGQEAMLRGDEEDFAGINLFIRK